MLTSPYQADSSVKCAYTSEGPVGVGLVSKTLIFQGIFVSSIITLRPLEALLTIKITNIINLTIFLEIRQN